MVVMQAQPETPAVADLDRLLACEDIRRLRAQYFRFVDAKRWDDLGALFAKDAVFDRGWGHGYRNPVTEQWSGGVECVPDPVNGREAIVAQIRSAVERLWTIHRGGDAEIFIDRADAARAVWAMTDELRDASGRLLLRGWGHYEESYRRLDGRWLIARTKLTRQYLEHEGHS